MECRIVWKVEKALGWDLGPWGRSQARTREGRKEGGRFQFYGKDQDSTPGPGYRRQACRISNADSSSDQENGHATDRPRRGREGETLRRCRNSPCGGMKPETCSAKPRTHTSRPCPLRDGKNVESGQSEGLRKKNGKRGGVPRQARQGGHGGGWAARQGKWSRQRPGGHRAKLGPIWKREVISRWRHLPVDAGEAECRRPTHKPAVGTTGQSGSF